MAALPLPLSFIAEPVRFYGPRVYRVAMDPRRGNVVLVVDGLRVGDEEVARKLYLSGDADARLIRLAGDCPGGLPSISAPCRGISLDAISKSLVSPAGDVFLLTHSDVRRFDAVDLVEDNVAWVEQIFSPYAVVVTLFTDDRVYGVASPPRLELVVGILREKRVFRLPLQMPPSNANLKPLSIAIANDDLLLLNFSERNERTIAFSVAVPTSFDAPLREVYPVKPYIHASRHVTNAGIWKWVQCGRGSALFHFTSSHRTMNVIVRDALTNCNVATWQPESQDAGIHSVCYAEPGILVVVYGANGQPRTINTDESVGWGALNPEEAFIARLWLKPIAWRTALAHGLVPAEFRIPLRALCLLRCRGDNETIAGGAASTTEADESADGWASLPLEVFEYVVAELWRQWLAPKVVPDSRFE